MREDQLKLLETRINNAIIFIETLKSREKRLIQEKEELDIKIGSFEKVLAEKDNKIEELKGSQGFLREKIEAILGKLESFATIDTEGQFDLKVFPENEKSEPIVPEGDGEDIIIEDEVVDLNEENLKDEISVEEKEEDLSGEGENTAEIPEEKQPDIAIDENPSDEMSDDSGDVLEGIINEDIFQEEKPAQDENVLQTETSVGESEDRENTSENAEEKSESGKEESLAMDTALEKNENLLFTTDGQNDNLNEINKIRDNTDGSFNKGWIDNNPFIQT
jgi:hypothetical protein